MTRIFARCSILFLREVRFVIFEKKTKKSDPKKRTLMDSSTNGKLTTEPYMAWN